MIEVHVDKFFALARERYGIYLRRQDNKPINEGGARPLWTDDKIFQTYRFCNLFRELDKTTVWFRENFREPLRHKASEVLIATVAFRWFNRISTGALLTDSDVGLYRGEWNSQHVMSLLRKNHPTGPYVTGAYIIKTPNGMSKLEGVCWCIDQALPGLKVLAAGFNHHNAGNTPLEAMHVFLTQFPFLGDFMAYEVVTDLRHTCWCYRAPDIMSWCNPGPGCARGLGWVVHDDFDKFNRGSKKDRALMQPHMAELLQLSTNEKYWPQLWPRWEMREVEHWLCETCKYVRVEQGGARPKERFKG